MVIGIEMMIKYMRIDIASKRSSYFFVVDENYNEYYLTVYVGDYIQRLIYITSFIDHKNPVWWI